MDRTKLTVSKLLEFLKENEVEDAYISIRHGNTVEPVNLDQMSINIKKECNFSNTTVHNTSYSIILDLENVNWIREMFAEENKKLDDFNDFVEYEDSEESKTER